MTKCDHKFIDSESCLKCGWTPKKCVRIFPHRDGSQLTCGKPAIVVAYEDTYLCANCYHDLVEDEPIEFSDNNVKPLKN